MAISDEQPTDSPVYFPDEEFKETAHIQSMETYRKMYLKSIENPELFWREMAEGFYFKEGPKEDFFKYNFDIRKGPIEIKWMEGAITNVCYNVLDRNIEKGLGDRTAIIWEGSEPFYHRTITYNELKSEVCKFANVLKKKGIAKGDRVAVYMPVTIELVVAMLACARIGAIHSVVFAGFSGDSIADRILDCNCKLLITCDGVYRGSKFIPLKEMADHAVQICKEHNHHLNGVIVYHHLKNHRSPDDESSTKVKSSRIGEAASNGQLNKSKSNGHLIGQSSGNKVSNQSNGQTKEQLIGKQTIQKCIKESISNGVENVQTNGQVKSQLKGPINLQIVNKMLATNHSSTQVNLTKGQQVIQQQASNGLLKAADDKADEAMDTSEPPVEVNKMLLDETYEIETDQNNNLVMIKCKATGEQQTKDVNNNVQECKISVNNQQVISNESSRVDLNNNKIVDEHSNEKANQTLSSNTPLNQVEIKSNDKQPTEQLNKKEEKQKQTVKVAINKPNSTSLQASSSIPTSSTTPNSPQQSLKLQTQLQQTTNNQITTSNNNSSTNNKTNVISKLRKIAADSVHNAIKFKKVDEQTAITTIANGLKSEKKVLKCANNGNESVASENVKINRLHLVDQLTKNRNDDLSSSPNENDQTLAQPPTQLQTKKASSTNQNNASSKLKIPWNPKIDSWWHDLMNQVDDVCEPVWLDAEHPLFILYTSGSTGKPKGVVHTSGGYMVYAATTFKYVFNYHGGDVFFCTADLGWITGTTVNCYGALANAATIVLFDGTPFYPTASRLWQIVSTHRVNIFYTAPTAIRSLMGCGPQWIENFDLSSLKLLGTAGEPINAQAWNWYYRVVGKSRCPIVDTYWSTESGAPLISSLPGCTPMKPGSASYPFFGVVPALLDDDGKELTGPAEGHLVFKSAWPSMIRTVDGNHHRFTYTYFSKFLGYYCAGDGARRDKDGYYWITGRTDDLLNVSGHLLSTAQVESALLCNDLVVEAAAVSSPHKVKGECIYCYIVLKKDCVYSKAIENELKTSVRKKIGAIATPEVLHVVSALPKTRSGKIMRRLLKQIAVGDTEFGDLSTIQDESILPEIYETRRIYVY